jgi:excisionase family DNA binding protein
MVRSTLTAALTEELLTTAEVAQMLRVSKATISRWVRDGELQAIRLPRGTYRFRRQDVEKLLERPEQPE